MSKKKEDYTAAAMFERAFSAKLETILSRIIYAAEEGETRLELDFCPSKGILDKLVSLGYIVMMPPQTHVNAPLCVIVWELDERATASHLVCG